MPSDGVGAVYTGAADFGKFSAILGGIFGTLIALFIGGIGIYFIIEANRRTKTASGTITESNCQTKTDESKTCMITVAYTSNQPSKMCTQKFTVQDESQFTKGKKVKVFFDSKDPCGSGSLESQKNANIVGAALIVAAAIILLIVWLVVYLAFEYKFFAAAEGVGTVVDILS